ncbi:hypothetical protein GLAREA_10490 [Glarea lozoyensis ATCC 20868]|uniref:Uncharacterized protein n=1 Tax=Glarea lozoyensis (strain ATCC 20868 / MF5171) TaxID=1116229 RepID=S3DAS8_GLAL2|nr:uncharacterized protein GLAREA_10490 [Glarea lozoyensis ATCC 20868]EPE34795.1 hypothetical protein GLAREA_10490 [Glarea lozoyensis ATCC 20868]
MSPTNTITQLGEALNDYTIHLTGHDATNHQMIEEDTLASNQRNWPTDYHRVPPHRPINRDLDPEERPRGSNTAEFIFISIMFTGVFTSAHSFGAGLEDRFVPIYSIMQLEGNGRHSELGKGRKGRRDLAYGTDLGLQTWDLMH